MPERRTMKHASGLIVSAARRRSSVKSVERAPSTGATTTGNRWQLGKQRARRATGNVHPRPRRGSVPASKTDGMDRTAEHREPAGPTAGTAAKGFRAGTNRLAGAHNAGIFRTCTAILPLAERSCADFVEHKPENLSCRAHFLRQGAHGAVGNGADSR
jgi:hypothetical protein